MSHSLGPYGLQPAKLLCPWNFPGKNTAVGSHFLLRGNFLTQGSNSGLLYGRQSPALQAVSCASVRFFPNSAIRDPDSKSLDRHPAAQLFQKYHNWVLLRMLSNKYLFSIRYLKFLWVLICLKNSETKQEIRSCALLPPAGEFLVLQRHKLHLSSEVAQSCLTLCDPMDCSLPGSSVHGIFQARILAWVAISFFKTALRGFVFYFQWLDPSTFF